MGHFFSGLALGIVIAVIVQCVIRKILSRRSQKKSEKKEAKNGFIAEQERKPEEQSAQMLSEYGERLSKIEKEVERLNFKLKAVNNEMGKVCRKSSQIPDKENERKEQEKLLPHSEQRQKAAAEQVFTPTEETEILQIINRCIKDSPETIADRLKDAGYPIEKQIEISNSAEILNNMELPKMNESLGGIIGIIPVSGKSGEYYALPTTRRIPKSQLAGGAFRYLFDWRSNVEIAEPHDSIIIRQIEKLPRVAYNRDAKGYQLQQGTKGLVWTNN